MTGLEPARCEAPVPKTGVSSIPPHQHIKLESRYPCATIGTLVMRPRLHNHYISFIEDPNFMAMRTFKLFFHWSLPFLYLIYYMIKIVILQTDYSFPICRLLTPAGTQPLMGTGGYPVAPPFQLPVSIILHYMYESQRVICCTHNSPFQLTEVRASHDLTHRFRLLMAKV